MVLREHYMTQIRSFYESDLNNTIIYNDLENRYNIRKKDVLSASLITFWFPMPEYSVLSPSPTT